MKKRLFLLGLLSFLYVNSQVVRLVELPSLAAVKETFSSDSETAKMVAVPVNDECDGAIELTVNADYGCESVTTATITDATNSGIEAEVGTADDDVWFTFVATNTTHRITLLNVEDDTDMVTEVLQGTCGGEFELVDYVDDPNILTVSELEVGETYYVRVYSYSSSFQQASFDICVGTPPGPPANDECDVATVLTPSSTDTCESSVAGTIQSATNSGISTTVGAADDDVWYSFTAVSLSHIVTLSDVDGEETTDLVIEVFEGTCDGLNSIKISDPESTLVTGLTVGLTYYIRVFSYGSANDADTTFDICVTTPGASPANDECDAAVELTVNEDLNCENVTSGTLVFATDSGIADQTGTADDDVWYYFTATSEAHRISALNIEGNTTDLVLEVFGGDCGSAIIKSSDPHTFSVTGLSEGTVYYLRVFSYGTLLADTTFDICIATLPEAPANDECDGAVVLTTSTALTCESPTSGTLQSATNSGLTATVGTPDDDVWYSFVATSPVHIVSLINLEGEVTTDMVFQVFEGDCNGLNSIKISDPESAIVNNLTIEQTYYIRVFSFGSDNNADTTFDICVSTPAPPPSNDDCENATELTATLESTCSTTIAGTVQSATNSGITTTVGTADDDVWYTFTALATSHLISLTNVEGEETTDMVIQVFDGNCDGLNSIKVSDPETAMVNDLIVGEIYYIRVYSFGSNNDADTTFNICVFTPGPPPANDECDASVELTVNDDYSCQAFASGTVAFATDSGIADETGTADDDVWYRFTATTDAHRISVFNIGGNNSDLVIELFDAECGGEILESSDPHSFVAHDLSEGSVYYLRVYSYAGGSNANTTFDICIGTLPAPPVNDECLDAVVLTATLNSTCATPTVGTVTAATDSGLTATVGTPNDDVWYSFEAIATSHIISLSNIEGEETTDLVLQVFQGTCDALTSIRISDPNTTAVSNLTIGEVYYIRVFSYGSDNDADTTFEICVSTPGTPPVNDECEDAIDLTVNNSATCTAFTSGTLASATDSGISEDTGTADDDVWYRFTATSDEHIISALNIVGNTTDLVIEVFDENCDGEIIASSDPETVTVSDLTAGSVYYVRVFSYFANSYANTTFDLCITTENLSTGDFTTNTLKAYPNPVKDILNVSNNVAITDVVIFNLLGQQVASKTINANEGQIDMSNLAAGAYLVKVTADNAVKTIKIIKE